jgi:hypothetical protein
MSWSRALRTHPVRALFPFAASAAMMGIAYFGTSTGFLAARIGRSLAGKELVTERTSREERRWIDEALPEVYLPSPVGPPPCLDGLRTVSPALREEIKGALAPQPPDLHQLSGLQLNHRDSWLPGLVLGNVLLREGRIIEADRVLTETLRRESVQVSLRSVLLADKEGTGGPPTEEVLALVHLLQAAGATRIAQHLSGPDLWWALRSPLAGAHLIGSRRENGLAISLPAWFEVPLPSPGCPEDGREITTYALYNNLIVGYLQNRDFVELEDRRLTAFARPYRDPPKENPLYSILQRLAGEWDPDREYLVWATSDAERLLRARLLSGMGLPRDPRLCVNLAQLLDRLDTVCPAEALQSLLAWRDGLVEIAREGRNRITLSQRRELEWALTRLAFVGATRNGRSPSIRWKDLGPLEAKTQKVIAALFTSWRTRAEPRTWARTVLERGGSSIREKLGKRTDAWLLASRRDLLDSLSQLAAIRQGSEKREVTRLAWTLLDGDDPRPPGMGNARSIAYLTPLRPGTGLIVLLAGVVSWLLAAWLALQVRAYQETTISFYRVEIEERLRRTRERAEESPMSRGES